MTGASPARPHSDPDPAAADPAVIAAAVGACPAVAGLHAGPVASYLPGARVPGVSTDGGRIQVHVDLRHPHTVGELRRQVTAAAAPLAGGLPVDITVADLVLPDPDTSPAPPGTPSLPANDPAIEGAP